ncbi:hypothetical protein GCM10023213_18300 [Prosthecobacter algae]|uniref:Uncharacterized protein n=1 Tax=Prosthecobacter algae TaxID=1144682 RepID=A0ABP9P297_9BACT
MQTFRAFHAFHQAMKAKGRMRQGRGLLPNEPAGEKGYAEMGWSARMRVACRPEMTKAAAQK